MPRHDRGWLMLLFGTHFLRVIVAFIAHVIIFTRVLGPIHCNATLMMISRLDFDRGRSKRL